MKYRFTPQAELEADREREWWRENRRDSPDLFDDELAAVIDKITRRPTTGTIHESEFPEEIRKVLMRKTSNHVYFTVHEGEIVILSVWGAAQEHGPKL